MAELDISLTENGARLANDIYRMADRHARIDELQKLAGQIGSRADVARHDDAEYSESYVLETVRTAIVNRLIELEEVSPA